MNDAAPTPPGREHPGTVRETLAVFLRLGLTSFGGPVAHLGYFREAFVERRRWLDDRAYADLVALCHVLPGPSSSQVGMAIGLQRAGIAGLLAAWVGFTLPSAVLLVAFAYGVSSFGDVSQEGWLLGLKAAAVAVVAHAVLGMARSLTPDAKRATIAAAAMIAVLLFPHPLIQLAAIAVAAIVGMMWLTSIDDDRMGASSFTVRTPRIVAIGCLTAFAVLLLGLPLTASATGSATVGLFDVFYRVGALVFGGGHVVLPLLQAETVHAGLVDPGRFLAGYGAAQAVPGPLFTFAGYLGAVMEGSPPRLLGAAIALIAIFLPSMLLLIGVLPFWERLRRSPRAQSALKGVNAGVVGILAAALYTPVFTEGVAGTPSLAIAVAMFVLLTAWKVPAWAVVLSAAVLGGILL